MKKRMLIDASQREETRVVMLQGDRLADFDLESVSKKQLKGNIYLAKVTRVEPSLQAAFVSYGGNRHGFLPFAEIHPDYYRIPIADREKLLAEQEELRAQIRARREAEAAADEAEEAAAELAATAPEPLADESDQSVQVLEDSNEVYTLNTQDIGNADDNDVVLAADETLPEMELDEVLSDTEDPVQVNEDGSEAAPSEDRGERPGRDGKFRGRGRGGKFRRRPGRREAALDQKLDELVDKSDTDNGDSDEYDMQPLWKRIRRAYKIQEVIKRGQIMLIQVVKEERGNKGAAVTSYITMPGRYCVLMPNSPDSGGISRKIGQAKDRRRMRHLLNDMNVPDGMSVILRTAGVERESDDIRHDLDYQMRLWDKVRDTTLRSSAPALIHEEGSLIKRAIRDHFSSDVEEILVAGKDGYETARALMQAHMPDHVDRIKLYEEPVPLFVKYNIETQLDAIHSNTVQLKSGGYLVINPTEALVSIDVNSGRSTRERHIEETALKTNMEAAEEVARQLRLRDLGGLVVIDFIDMENRRYNAQVERKLRDALSKDKARIQMGRISNFGLLELSRQRLRPSVTETHFDTCPHCRGTGLVRTVDSQALMVLRAIEAQGIDGRAGEITVTVPDHVLVFILNHKRDQLSRLSEQYALIVLFKVGALLDTEAGYHIDISAARRAEHIDDVDGLVEPDLEDDDTAPVAKAADTERRPAAKRAARAPRPERAEKPERAPRKAEVDTPQADNIELMEDDIDPSQLLTPEEIEALNNGEILRKPRSRGGRNRYGKEGKVSTRRTTVENDTAEASIPTPNALQPMINTQAANIDTASAPKPVVDRSPRSSAVYDVTTQASGDKREGWWKRLIK